MDNLEEVKESKSKGKRITKQYSYDVKLRAVKLYLEEGFAKFLVRKGAWSQENTHWGWLRAYRERGEAGLRGRVVKPGTRRRLPARCKRRSLS